VTALVVARHLVVGSYAQITATTQATHRRGRLVSVSPPRALADGRWAVRLEVLEPAGTAALDMRRATLSAATSSQVVPRAEPVYFPVRIPAAAPAPRRRRRWRGRLVVVLVVLAVLGGLVAELVSLVAKGLGWLGAHGDVVGGTAVAVAAVVAVLAVPAARCCLDLARRGCGH
jgi:hypothetical protein